MRDAGSTGEAGVARVFSVSLRDLRPSPSSNMTQKRGISHVLQTLQTGSYY